MFTRREFATIALSGLFVRAAQDSTLHAAFAGQAGSGAAGAAMNGVRVGAQTYSFRALPRPAEGDMSDALVKALTECGLRECELWSPQLEPAKVPREQLLRLAPGDAAGSLLCHP
jgi:hypothetical protein